MRLRALFFVLTALAGVGAAAHRLGAMATGYVEARTREGAAAGLTSAGEAWAAVETDGLIVTLTGAAPDEARRLRAAEILRQIVDPRRLRDATTLAAADPLAPPPFALELLRNETEVSLIGLAPETAGRAAIAAALTAGGLDGAVSDMLESVAHPAPEGWEAALGFGLAALGELPRAKISVTPGRVAVTALAESDPARREIAAALRARRPEGVELDVDITAPRPVVAPFRVDFELGDGTARFAACTAESPEDAAAIAAAAGLATAPCALGLGAPSPDWAAAAAAGIAAVRALGGGRFAITDIEAALTVPAAVAPERVTAATAALEAALAEPFSLDVVAPPPAPPDAAGVEPPAARFDAVLLADGSVRLTGTVQDDVSRAAIESYAAALFGHDRVDNATVIDPVLPDGWPGRVLVGVEALALLKEGALAVTPEGVALDGWSETADGEAKAATLFAAKEMGPADLELRFDAAAAAATATALAEAADPAGTCAAAVAAAQAGATLAFRPGSAELEDGAATAIAALAAVFADCPPVDFEVAGHTDGQGRAEANQTLSEDRAAAVKAALEAADLPHIGFVARGYGADRPIADNETEAGRARNRRIEFTLLAPEPAPAPVTMWEDPAADGPY